VSRFTTGPGAPTISGVSPQCQSCGHSAKQHNLDGDRACRVKILSGWSDERCQYTASKPCLCTGYAGLDPEVDTCAHEFLPQSEHPRTCVQCGKVIAPT
jgi:hypothetical protein